MKMIQDRYRVAGAEQKSQEIKPKDKFNQLYSASMERLERRSLYANCLDKACTFKPNLVANWNGNLTVGSSIFGRFTPKAQNKSLNPPGLPFSFTPRINNSSNDLSARNRSAGAIRRCNYLYESGLDSMLR